MRKKRIKPNRAVTFYHLMTRTAQQCFWLQDHQFRDKLKAIIQFYCRVYYVELVRFAIMGNHYHVVVKSMKPRCDLADVRSRFELAQTRLAYPQRWHDSLLDRYHKRYSDISMLAWEINYHSARIHNRENDTSGHLWGSRFKSQIVEEGDNLLEVMAYVDLNPVAAKMATDSVDYPYCSASEDMNLLMSGAIPEVFPAGFLKNYSQRDRPIYYLMWLKVRALMKNGSTAEPPLTHITLALTEKTITAEALLDAGLIELARQCHENPPPGWSTPVLGSSAFVTEVTALYESEPANVSSEPGDGESASDRAPPGQTRY